MVVLGGVRFFMGEVPLYLDRNKEGEAPFAKGKAHFLEGDRLW